MVASDTTKCPRHRVVAVRCARECNRAIDIFFLLATEKALRKWKLFDCSLHSVAMLCFAISTKPEILFCSFVHVLKFYFRASLFFYESVTQF